MSEADGDIAKLEDWLLGWFESRAAVRGETRSEKLAVNYFDAALIDSFGVIDLITDVEDKFQVAFSSDDFLDRRFATIGGLASVLHQRTSASSEE